MFSSADSVYEQLKASSKSVLLTNIKFKEAMYADEEEDKIKSKYKPINPQYRLYSSPGQVVANCNGHQKVKSTPISEPGDDMPKPKVVLYSPEKVELQWKESKRIGPGLCNLGNTCFLNSVLQVLTYTAPLVNFISSDAHRTNCEAVGFCMLCELRNHMFRVLKHNPHAGPIRPLTIVQKLSYIGKHFKFGRQEDAHEFLRYVIDGVQKSCLAGKPKLDKMSKETTVVNQIFGGFYRSQVICLACKHRSNTYDPMFEMNLDIKESNSVENALRRSVRPERLDGENKYQCDRCRGKRPALKRSTIHKSPNVFTLQFKRFDFNRIFGGKISKHVSYSEELNLRPFMSVTEGQPILYKLYAVLVHSGFSCNSGHYYCYVKAPNGAWYEMNDSRVSQVSIKTVLNTEAYLLFYTRKSPLREKHVLNGNGHANHVTLNAEKKKMTPTPGVIPAAGVKQGVSPLGAAQSSQGSAKMNQSCPKLIPLNLNQPGKLSFKISGPNKASESLKHSKLVQPKQSGKETASPTKQNKLTESSCNAKVMEQKKEQKSSASVKAPMQTPKRKGLAINGMERLKEYNSDSDSSTEENSAKSAVDKKHAETPGKEISMSPASRSPKTIAFPSDKSSDGFSTKVGTGSNESGPRGELAGNTKVKEASPAAKESRSADDSSMPSTKPPTGGDSVNKAKINISDVESHAVKGNTGTVSSPSTDTAAKHDGKSTEDHKSKSSHLHSKSFLFSPPLVPTMRPWLPTKHLTVGRTIFKRSISEPDATHRKHHSDSEGKPDAVSEAPVKLSKWHTFERQMSEHLFGPMTPPLKDNSKRERTNSINSEASSVASVSSKVGEWDVHERDQDETTGSKKIPERQFAGWDVKDHGDDAHDEDDRAKQDCARDSDEHATSLERKRKKKKKKKSKKKTRHESENENDGDRAPLLSSRKRQREEEEESEREVEPKRAKKKKKKKSKHKEKIHKDRKDSKSSKSEEDSLSQRSRQDDKRWNKHSGHTTVKPETNLKRKREVMEEERPKDKTAVMPDSVRSSVDPGVNASVRCNEEVKQQQRSSADDDRHRHCSNDSRSKKGVAREEKEDKEWRKKSGGSKRESIEKWVKKGAQGNRSSISSSSDSDGSVGCYSSKKKKKKSTEVSESAQRIRNSNHVNNSSNLKEGVPCKEWDDNTLSTPRSTSSSADILDTLFKDKGRALGTKVKNWDGTENEIDTMCADDERRRKRDKWDDEYDEGRQKKVKETPKQRFKSKSKFSFNPFQRVQNTRNDKSSVDRPKHR